MEKLMEMDTETTISMIAMKTEHAQYLMENVIEGCFVWTDVNRALADIKYDYYRIKAFMEIVWDLLGQIGTECNTWNEQLEALLKAERKQEKAPEGGKKNV